MKGLAKRLAPGEEEYWGIAGLLHDLDEEQCDWQNDMSVHGPTSVEILKKEGIDDPVLFEAIKAHNPKCGKKAKTKIEYALLAADPMSGFVKAVAQIYPDKKIASVKHKSVMKRFNDTERGTNSLQRWGQMERLLWIILSMMRKKPVLTKLSSLSARI